MKKQLTTEDYIKIFDNFLESKGVRQVFYKSLQVDKEKFFKEHPNVHWLVMAFNWARVNCPAHKTNPKYSPTGNNERNWKLVDNDWRVAIMEAQGMFE